MSSCGVKHALVLLCSAWILFRVSVHIDTQFVVRTSTTALWISARSEIRTYESDTNDWGHMETVPLRYFELGFTCFIFQ